MTITELLENEAGWLERLADLADAGMVDEARALFDEVRRLRADNATLSGGVINLAATTARLRDMLDPPVANPLYDPAP